MTTPLVPTNDIESNSLAVVYLLLLHFWTFVLLIFHVHGFETIHGNLGGRGVTPHGPGALMQKAAIVTVPNGN